METTLEMGLGDVPPPPLNFTLIENTQEICVVCSRISSNLVANTANVCTVEK